MEDVGSFKSTYVHLNNINIEGPYSWNSALFLIPKIPWICLDCGSVCRWFSRWKTNLLCYLPTTTIATIQIHVQCSTTGMGVCEPSQDHSNTIWNTQKQLNPQSRTPGVLLLVFQGVLLHHVANPPTEFSSHLPKTTSQSMVRLPLDIHRLKER